MKATLKKIDSIRQQIDVEVSKEEVDKAYEEALSEVKKEAQVKGFRKGMVPEKIILQKYGDEIRSEAVKRAVSKTYPAAVVETGANPINSPKIEIISFIDKGSEMTYRATFEIYPEVTVKNYEKMELTREKVEAKDEEVEAELKRLQQMMTQLEPASDLGMGPGMVGSIDFKGTAGGEDFPGSTAENYLVDFGSGALLKDFEKQIEGMKASEDRTIEFDYPADYFRKEIAGKRGRFSVKMKDVRKKIVPELNDDFAKELGKFESLKDVRAELKKRIAEYKETVQKNSLTNQAMEKLIEMHKDLEVPATLVDAELGNMLEQLKHRLESEGKTIQDAKIDPKEFVDAHIKEAEDRSRGYMLIRAIADQEKVAVTEEELEKRIAQIAEANKTTPEKVKAEFAKEDRMEKLRVQLTFEKAIDLVVAKAKVKEVKPKKDKK